MLSFVVCFIWMKKEINGLRISFKCEETEHFFLFCFHCSSHPFFSRGGFFFLEPTGFFFFKPFHTHGTKHFSPNSIHTQWDTHWHTTLDASVSQHHNNTQQHYTCAPWSCPFLWIRCSCWFFFLRTLECNPFPLKKGVLWGFFAGHYKIGRKKKHQNEETFA